MRDILKKYYLLEKKLLLVEKLVFLEINIKLTNPKYISEDSSLIKQKHNNYSLTEGISEKFIIK